MNSQIFDTKIAIFKGKQIRKTIYKSERWFSVVDVVTRSASRWIKGRERKM